MFLKPIKGIIENSDISLEKIDVINQLNPDHSIYDLKLLRTLSNKSISHNSSVKWLLAAAALLLLTCITPLIINYIHIYQLSQELEKMESTVAEVNKLQHEYQKMLDHVGYLVKIKAKNPSIIELLNVLTKAAPDHTHVRRLSLEGGLLSLQGLSASASELIPVLDETGLFEDIRFAAPVTQAGVDDLERYSITAKLVSYKNE